MKIRLVAVNKDVSKYSSTNCPRVDIYNTILNIYNMQKLPASIRLELDTFDNIDKQYRPDIM